MRLSDEENEEDDGHNIGDHGKELHVDTGGATENDLKSGTETEQEAADEGALWTELSENNGSDGDEALADDGNRTELGGNGHVDAGTAKTGKESGNGDAEETHADDVDAQGFAGLRMLTAGTQTQAEACLVEDEPDNEGGKEDQVDGGIVGKNVVHKPAKYGGGIEDSGEELWNLLGGGQGDGVCGVEQNLCDHDHDAGSQHVDGGTGNGLISSQLDGGEGMEHAENGTGKTAADKSDPGIACEISDDGSGKGAGGHHAFNTDVDDAGNLGKTGTESGVEQRSRINQCGIKDDAKTVNEIGHAFASFPDAFLRCCRRRLRPVNSKIEEMAMKKTTVPTMTLISCVGAPTRFSLLPP